MVDRQVADCLPLKILSIITYIRQNFDPQQRQHFINIAKQYFPQVEISALVFTTTPEVKCFRKCNETLLNVRREQECLKRLRYRTDHETIHNFQDAQRLLEQFLAIWRPPTATEVNLFLMIAVLALKLSLFKGFAKIVFLEPDLPLAWDEDDLNKIYNTLVSAPTLSTASSPRNQYYPRTQPPQGFISSNYQTSQYNPPPSNSRYNSISTNYIPPHQR